MFYCHVFAVSCFFLCLFFFFFKQKTAYEMRISDWSSDVCSSDLLALDAHGAECAIRRELPFSGTVPTQITLSLSLPGRTIREIRLRVTGDERPDQSAVNPPPIDFLVTLANWADGTFIRWLGKTLL